MRVEHAVSGALSWASTSTTPASDETVVLAGTQIKWAQPLSDTLAAGLVVAAFVAERFRELATNYWRAGARFAPMPAVTVDLSHARGINEAAPSRWAVGVT